MKEVIDTKRDLNDQYIAEDEAVRNIKRILNLPALDLEIIPSFNEKDDRVVELDQRYCDMTLKEAFWNLDSIERKNYANAEKRKLGEIFKDYKADTLTPMPVENGWNISVNRQKKLLTTFMISVCKVCGYSISLTLMGHSYSLEVNNEIDNFTRREPVRHQENFYCSKIDSYNQKRYDVLCAVLGEELWKEYKSLEKNKYTSSKYILSLDSMLEKNFYTILTTEDDSKEGLLGRWFSEYSREDLCVNDIPAKFFPFLRFNRFSLNWPELHHDSFLLKIHGFIDPNVNVKDISPLVFIKDHHFNFITNYFVDKNLEISQAFKQEILEIIEDTPLTLISLSCWQAKNTYLRASDEGNYNNLVINRTKSTLRTSLRRNTERKNNLCAEKYLDFVDISDHFLEYISGFDENLSIRELKLLSPLEIAAKMPY